jgi:hypothetical protein
MLFVDHKYALLLSNRLERFTKLNSKSYNFRCPICGDSKKNTYKARGYLYEKKDTMLYYCHNCGASMSIGNFLKQVDSTLYDEYRQESYLNKDRPVVVQPDITKIVWPKYRVDSPLKTLKKISQLSSDHPAKRYVEARRIPARTHYKIFYAPKFRSWVNNIIPDKLDTSEGDEPRLILPFISKNNECFGVQGRSFTPNGQRYITIMFNESFPKLFGLDTIDESKTIFVTEGPIDSLFLDNAIAMAGADIDPDYVTISQSNLVLIYDNEPRNKHIVQRMEKAIDRGYNIVIWPDHIEQKDINDMALANIDFTNIINRNIFSGLSAKARLLQWKRI